MVTGTIDMTKSFVVDPESDSPTARRFATLLERACPLTPVRISLEWSWDSPTSSCTATRLGRDRDATPEELLATPSNEVRTLLAYIGNALMRVQLYGGYMHRAVEVAGTPYRAVFFMSNQAFGGYWLRLEVYSLAESAAASES